jgi:hypothetical protein
VRASAGALEAVRARDVLSAAAKAGRRHWLRVIAVAVVVFGLAALLETVVEAWGDNWSVGWFVVVDVLAFSADILGEVFYVGVLDRLVGEAAHGGPAQSVPTILRTLPYGRLILADVVVTILVIVGIFAFFLPGAILFTLLCLSGPIVNIENRPAMSALRRSAQLVRKRFWLTVFLVTIPFFIADSIATSVQDAAHSLPLAADFCVHATVATVIAIVTGLIQVELAHRLIEADTHDERPATT